MTDAPSRCVVSGARIAAESHDCKRSHDIQLGVSDWECAPVAKGGTLMGMRSAAALLLVTLIGPSITSALCDLTCVHHEHHSAQTESAQSCHEQRSNDGPVVTSGTAGFCHDQAETFTTTAADPRLLKATPVAVQLPSSLAAYHPQLQPVGRSTSFGPPGIVLQTTPLRI